MKRKAKLLRYFNEQAGHCVYCDIKMTLGLGQPNTAEVEHVTPRSKGGAKEAYNEVAACHECNQSKADKSVATWLREQTGLRHAVQAKSNIIMFNPKTEIA